jgi:hypothetical protein
LIELPAVRCRVYAYYQNKFTAKGMRVDIIRSALRKRTPDHFAAIVAYCIVCLAGLSDALAVVYYVDPGSGLDSNAGTEPEKAWASLEKINEQVFKPGDTILLAAGSQFVGQLKPQGSGTASAPIRLDRYGKGPNPAIHGEGKSLHTLLLHNVQHWEVRNLEITNRGAEPEPRRRGVVVSARDFGDCHHIVLENLEIHDVNGCLLKHEGGGSGILWSNRGDQIKTRFIDLQILNCHIHHCQRNAINSKGYSDRDSWHPSLGVVVRGNLIEHVPGDGIVSVGTKGALIENNVIRKGVDSLPHGEAAAGIWPWSSDDTLIQFNEVSDHRAKWDGQGLDSDFNSRGTIIQFNYSHGNWGGFILVCNKGETYGSSANIGTKNSVIRYNLSLNDGLRPYKARNDRFFSPIFHVTGPVENTRFDHNIIIMPPKPDARIENALFEVGDWGGSSPKNTQFFKNIVRNPFAAKMNYGIAKEAINEQNDIGEKFPFDERNPTKILSQFESHPYFQNQDEFRLLQKFVAHRFQKGASQKGAGGP